MSVIHFTFIGAFVAACSWGWAAAVHREWIVFAGIGIGCAISMGGPKLWEKSYPWRFKLAARRWRR